MKALHLIAPRSFERVDIPNPSLPRNSHEHLVVRTAFVSLCGSDIPFFTGRKRLRPYPMPPGTPVHECVGEVMESTSDQFRPGDRVLSIPDGDQGLAEYFLAQASRTIHLKGSIEDPGAACIIQPLSTVVNAVDRLGDVRGKSIAVVGLGSIGLFFCWLAARRGAGAVIGIDPIESRCRAAKACGATQTICGSSIEVVHRSRAAGSAWSFPDICIEAVGHQMDTINDALELVRRRGAVLAFGVPDHNVYALEYETFFRKNVILIAAVTPDWTDYLAKARDLFLANQKELSAFVTHRLPIRDAQKAFKMYEQHADGIIKAVIDAAVWQ